MDSSLQNTPCPNDDSMATMTSLTPILLPHTSENINVAEHALDHHYHGAMPSLPPTPISCTLDHATTLSPSAIMHKVIAPPLMEDIELMNHEKINVIKQNIISPTSPK